MCQMLLCWGCGFDPEGTAAGRKPPLILDWNHNEESGNKKIVRNLKHQNVSLYYSAKTE